MQGIVNFGDVGVVQASLYFDFSHEPQKLTIGGNVSEEYFDSLFAFGDPVLHLEDLSHASRAEHGNNPIIADVFANVKTHVQLSTR
jgi:phosphoribosylformimino-5-aminoimidazole carboxamide ribonucleotide (ProFAR) isomerase